MLFQILTAGTTRATVYHSYLNVERLSQAPRYLGGAASHLATTTITSILLHLFIKSFLQRVYIDGGNICLVCNPHPSAEISVSKGKTLRNSQNKDYQ